MSCPRLDWKQQRDISTVEPAIVCHSRKDKEACLFLKKIILDHYQGRITDGASTIRMTEKYYLDKYQEITDSQFFELLIRPGVEDSQSV